MAPPQVITATNDRVYMDNVNWHKLRDPSLLKSGVCYVDGSWITAQSGKVFDVHDPSNDTKIAQCPDFGQADTTVVIDAAYAALPEYSRLSGRQRSKLLRKWYDLVIENSHDLGVLITWENGKPIAEGNGEVQFAASLIEWFSEEAPRIYGDSIPSSCGKKHIVTHREPIGVCALITPWNFPAAMVTRKAGAALAAGCTVVCKVAVETPLTALALAELASRAGFPKGVFNVITASTENTPAVGKILTTHPIIKKVSFTGSTRVGKLLAEQSASTLKKLSLELGGNAPFIVFDNADLEAAIAGAIVCKFRGSGQTCVCANRFFIHAKVYDEFVNRLTKIMQTTFKVGSGFDKGTTHGPLIHQGSVSRLDEWISEAKSKGASITGGGKVDGPGSFYQPTLITGATPAMRVAQEELFGPVAVIFSFESEDELVERVNSVSVGLAGYIWSTDTRCIQRVSERLELGMIGVNTPIVADAASPFGGIKESGYGLEGSKYGVQEYTVLKTMTYSKSD
ncbi:succinate-semialdehyde dehydrogenase nADP+ [Fusarium flagelliforme]|uniref:succinate-semialdehyde dehydrogenase [NAD(P)(+)] n=2 Tax=Fusarium flagelliforme TaxID=2675880 RepID=A0A395N4C6_9HYPO|nr:succinate-semialdehyde dehydrogenase nADP+ [Fusarium flagelliforme]